MKRDPNQQSHAFPIWSVIIAGSAATALALSCLGSRQTDPQRDDLVVRTAATQPHPGTLVDLPARNGQREDASKSGWYRAEVGTRLSFRIRTRSRTTLLHGQRQASDNTIELSGDLEVLIADRRREEIFTTVRLAQATARCGQARHAEEKARLDALATDLRRTVELRMDGAGRILAMRFPDSYDPVARIQLRDVLAKFRFVVPDTQSRDWTTREHNETGEFETRYSRMSTPKDATLRRQRLRCLSVTGGMDKVCATVRKSLATGSFSTDAGWLENADVHEEIQTRVEGASLTARSSFRGTMRLESITRVEASQLPRADWTAPWSSATTRPEEHTAHGREAELQHIRASLEGTSLTGLLAELDALLANDQMGSEGWDRAWTKLSHLFELRPEVIADAVSLIERQAVAESTAVAMLTALGNAGSAAAQSALTRIHGSATAPTAIREGAVVAMSQLDKPGSELMGALFDASRRGDSKTPLAATTLMVLGVLAPRSPAIDGRPAVQGLLSLEAAHRKGRTEDVWLQALGNTADPVVFDRAAAYLGAERDIVREAAVAALRDIRTPDALRALRRQATRDKSVRVRAQIADSLRVQGSAAAIATIRDVLLKDGSAHVREAALRALLGNHDRATKDAVARVAQGDAVEALRKLAMQVLSS